MGKLKLQYIWTKGYNCFSDIEFNFSNKYSLHFDKKNIMSSNLTCEENTDYVGDFWGEYIDLTTVIGNNGAGKTTLLELIVFIRSCIMGKIGWLHECMCLFIFDNGIENKKIYWYSNFIDNFCGEIIEKSVSVFFQKKETNEELKKLILNNFNIIYHTNVLANNIFDKDYIGITESIKDISLISMLKRTIENNKFSKDILPNYLSDEIKQQCKFIINYQKRSELFDFKLPSWMTIEFSFIEIVKDEYNNNKFNKITKYLKKHFEKLFIASDSKECMTEEMILERFSHNAFRSYLNCDFNKIHYEIIEKSLPDNEESDIWECLNDGLKEGKVKEYFIPYYRFIKWVDENTGIFQKCLQRKFITYIDVNNKKFDEFLNYYFACSKYSSFLNFSWGLSSGEMAIFSLFSRLFSISENNKMKLEDNNNISSAILCLDEADMLFHPEWQRKYINSLVKFLPEIYRGTYLQVIIATHSPIILSDIPKQNVIYLYKNQNGEITVDKNAEHSETFGANIYKLFNDAFFLKEGSIGEFAEEKIKGLLKLIHTSADQEKEKIKSMINIIGDQFLKSKIERMFYERLNNETNKETRLMELEEKKNNIQKEIDNIKRNIKND